MAYTTHKLFLLENNKNSLQERDNIIKICEYKKINDEKDSVYIESSLLNLIQIKTYKLVFTGDV